MKVDLRMGTKVFNIHKGYTPTSKFILLKGMIRSLMPSMRNDDGFWNLLH